MKLGNQGIKTSGSGEMIRMILTQEFLYRYECIVKDAGAMIKDAILSEDSVHQKGGLANFVTSFDIEVQKFLIHNLKQLLPEASFFGEEDTEGNNRSTNGYCFYIDPIDGTTNFIFGYMHSCVSVGLSYDNQIIAGFVYNPYVDTMYKAVRGQGAYRNGNKLMIKDKSIQDGIVSFGCARYNEGDTDLLFATVKELYLRSLSVRNGGSAALDLCRIATGANVVYLELKLMPYDYAAASIIIREAGGFIQQVDGSEITLDGPCSILAGTLRAMDEVRVIIGNYH